MPAHRLRTRLGADANSDAYLASEDSKRLCSRGFHPIALLAFRQALDDLGNRRHAPTLGESLFHGGQAVSKHRTVDGGVAGTHVNFVENNVTDQNT
jgi:hypothetical protein